MLIKNFIARLQAIQEQLNNDRPRDTELIGREALALVRLRVQNTGKKFDGQQFGNYSDNPLPPFFFAGKSLNQSGEQAVKQAQKDGKGLSYKGFRDANNRPTDKVDLTFTGAMWREMDVQISQADSKQATATIQPRTARSRKVANFNSVRYGNILRISKQEIDKLKTANFNRVLRIFKNNLP